MTAITQSSRYVEWSPVIAGTVVACAASVLLLQASHALGLSFTNLSSTTTITPLSIMVVGLWTLWTQLLASVSGGYMAGRMLNPWPGAHESELRDGAHGLLVWALSTVLTALVVGTAAAVSALAVQHGADAQTTISPELEKKIAIISGFSLFAISLVSAVAAWFMGTVGGDHRDSKVGAQRVTFRRPK